MSEKLNVHGKVRVLKSPTIEEINLCAKLALGTEGKTPSSIDRHLWLKRMFQCEHSPIRVLTYILEFSMPYYVSTHFVRHHVGIDHFVTSQRNDRQHNYDRRKAPQDAEVVHRIVINAQSLINVSRKRLCNCADPVTRQYWEEAKRVISLEGESSCSGVVAQYMVPECVYRGGNCPEFRGCGIFPKMCYNDALNDFLTAQEQRRKDNHNAN